MKLQYQFLPIIFDVTQSLFFMCKRILLVSAVLIFILRAQAQIGVMKLIGNNTQDYSLGFGAYIKSGIPASEAADITIELGADIFPMKGSGYRYGTIMCPLKIGYRYTLNGTGQGFYFEPQAGYNLVGITSLSDENGQTVN